jgi:hypothetical protein
MIDPTRRRIVEGEPGIFPAPIASVLRAFGRVFTRDKKKPPEPPPPEADATEEG